MAPRRSGWLLALPTLCACSGGGGEPVFDFGSRPVLLRAGEAFELAPTTATGSDFVVTPDLPAGLGLDPATGAIRGTPTAASTSEGYVVRGMLNGREVTDTVQLAIGAVLPAEVASLESGFAVERFATLTQAPGKFAVAPDGRVFVCERASGVIRIVDPSGALLSTPFATVAVTTGNHRGLLGIVLSPDFATDARVFGLATVPAGSGKPERSVLYRWTDAAGIGQNRTVLLDDLPVSVINNGGALCFDADGMLVVSVGDVEDASLAQADGSLAGKLLRIDPDDGSVPADNPSPASPVFAKGLRNVWALTVDPIAGSLFAADNGPANNDELLLVQAGRNFEWGAQPGEQFGALAGLQLRLWTDVVVPTGLAFARAEQMPDWPAAQLRSLFVSLYDEEIVLRLEMSGALRTDIDREVPFLTFRPDGISNKPVDLVRAADGKLWLLTFSAIYRIDRIR